MSGGSRNGAWLVGGWIPKRIWPVMAREAIPSKRMRGNQPIRKPRPESVASTRCDRSPTTRMNCIITGAKNAGKTTVVKRVVANLRTRGLQPVGFYTTGDPDLLELVDVKTGDRVPFGSSRRSFPGELSVGRYSINPAAIEMGLKASDEPGDVLVVDEIGTMETRGEGFAPLLATLEPTAYRGTLFSVRRDVVPFVRRAFPSDARVERLEVTRHNRDELPRTVTDVVTRVDS